MVLMQAEKNAGVLIAQMIDQGIVEAAIGGARIEADERDIEPAQHLRRDIAAPANRFVRRSLGLVQPHAHSPFSFETM